MGRFFSGENKFYSAIVYSWVGFFFSVDSKTEEMWFSALNIMQKEKEEILLQ